MILTHEFTIIRFDTGAGITPVDLFLDSETSQVTSHLWPCLLADTSPARQLGIPVPFSTDLIGKKIICQIEFFEGEIPEDQAKGTLVPSCFRERDLTKFLQGIDKELPEPVNVYRLDLYTDLTRAFPRYKIVISLSEAVFREIKEQSAHTAKVTFKMV